VVSKVPDDQVMADLDACVAWAKSHGGDTTRLGITGFCWGGRIVWLYAAHHPGVKAGVAWYGRLTSATSGLTPKHPLDMAGKLNGPVLGLYGGQDPGIPLDTVEKMKTALAQSANPASKASHPCLLRRAPRLPRRLPAQLPQGACRGWLEADGRVVQEARGLKASGRMRKFLALSFDGQTPQGTVTFHEGFSHKKAQATL
jgi:dienelactone hydrolase